MLSVLPFVLMHVDVLKIEKHWCFPLSGADYLSFCHQRACNGITIIGGHLKCFKNGILQARVIDNNRYPKSINSIDNSQTHRKKFFFNQLTKIAWNQLLKSPENSLMVLFIFVHLNADVAVRL